MADILTLAEYKSLQGIQSGDTRNDAQITALLPAASRAVRTYTGRQFEVNLGVATTRVYQHDGSEMLDIDDCTAITGLSTDAGVPGTSFDLTADQWVAMPQDDSDVFYYVILYGGPFNGMSGEMGFTRNLDTYESLLARRPMISVTATWGWPAIPSDVKLATAMTVGELVSAPGKAEGLSAEAIEGWSRQWGSRIGTAALAVPNRARDLLVNYQRVLV